MPTKKHTQEKEIWKPVPIKGFQHLYSISNLGRVRRDAPGINTFPNRILKPLKTAFGYRRIVLFNQGTSLRLPIHRLVAKAFIPNKNNRKDINHKDSNPGNNRAYNLEWTTPSENAKHGYQYGKRKPTQGAINGRAKLSETNIRQIRQLRKTGLLQREIAKRFDISREHVRDILLYKRWKHIK